jgi:multiple antibiotic resistance protein
LFKQILQNFITLFVVLDPIGTVPIFLIATAGLNPRDRNQVAVTSVLIATGVLMIFLGCAQYILEEMHISTAAFRIAGGSILFVFALQMILQGHHQSAAPEATRSLLEIAVFPIAMPMIAGPGSLLAVVLLTDNNHNSIAEQALTALITVAVLACTLGALLLAGRIQRYLGRAGIIVMTQVMGLVLAAFAVQQILDGLLEVLRPA